MQKMKSLIKILIISFISIFTLTTTSHADIMDELKKVQTDTEIAYLMSLYPGSFKNELTVGVFNLANMSNLKNAIDHVGQGGTMSMQWNRAGVCLFHQKKDADNGTYKVSELMYLNRIYGQESSGNYLSTIQIVNSSNKNNRPSPTKITNTTEAKKINAMAYSMWYRLRYGYVENVLDDKIMIEGTGRTTANFQSKEALQKLFRDLKGTLMNQGVSSSFFGEDGLASGGDAYQTIRDEAEAYGEAATNYKEKPDKISDEKNIKVETKNGSTYIGPFKFSYKNNDDQNDYKRIVGLTAQKFNKENVYIVNRTNKSTSASAVTSSDLAYQTTAPWIKFKEVNLQINDNESYVIKIDKQPSRPTSSNSDLQTMKDNEENYFNQLIKLYPTNGDNSIVQEDVMLVKKNSDGSYTGFTEKEKTNLSNDTFYIKINGTKNIEKATITAKTSFEKYSALSMLLTGTSAQAQCKAAYAGYKETKENSVTWNYSKANSLGDLQIIKKDQTGSRLPNVGFEIKNEKGQYVNMSTDGTISYTSSPQTFMTNTSGIIELKGLQIGKYTIIETINPNYGYIVENVKVDVEIEGNTTKIIDNKKELSELRIVKTDSESGARLQGAKFTIKMIDGPSDYVGKYINRSSGIATESSYQKTPVELTTNANGEIYISNVIAGTYEITEVEAPEGYIITTKSKTAEVVRGKQETKVTFENEKGEPEYGSLQIIKVDDTTKERLQGAKFTIQLVDTTSENSQYKGKYVKINGSSTDITYQNTPEEIQVDSNGEIWIQNLVEGVYEIVEVQAPTGYIASTGSERVQVTNKQTATKTFENRKDEPEPEPEPETGNLKIQKVDSQTKQLLQGAKFTIQMTDGPEEYKNKYINISNGTVSENSYQNSSYILQTNSNGEINLQGLYVGTYKITEVEAPTGYIISKTNETVQIETNNTKEILWENDKKKEYGHLKIIKEGSSGEKLSNVSFNILRSDGLYVNRSANGTISYSSTAQEFVTNSSGIIEIQNLEVGNYKLIETANPNYGYVVNSMEIYIEIQANNTLEQTVTNEINLAAGLKIKKEDNITAQKLEGAKFTIQMIDGPSEYKGKYVNISSGSASKNSYQSSAVELVTNSNGEISISNLIAGEYEIVETAAPDRYEILTKTQKVTLTAGSTSITEITVKNRRKYIDVKGIVWEDGQEGKGSLRDDKYTQGENLLSDVEVIFRSGNVELKTTTNSNGEYSFERVDIDLLQNANIEFIYNGMKFEAVSTAYMKQENGSKAAEISRETFNKGFSTISSNNFGDTSMAYSSNRTIEYTKDQYKRSIQYTSPENYAQDKYHMSSTTKQAGFEISSAYDPYTGIASNINLGLYYREQPDIALVNDIDNVKITINDKEYTYYYGNKLQENLFDVDVTVKFGNKYGSMAYTRPVYPADVNYVEDQSKEMKVFVTYKTAIKNESTTLKMKPTEIVNYYDNKYAGIVQSWIDGSNETVNWSPNSKYVNTTNATQEYNYSYANIDKTINPQEQLTICTQIQLTREQITDILSDKEVILNNVLEIMAYSTYDTNNQEYAGVDKDSAPGNATPGNVDTYEDDTDSAPAFKLVKNEERKVVGVVFEDKTSDATVTGAERLGDGKLTAEDTKRLEGVKVTLVENSTGKTYETTTAADGSYTIEGFTPGEYTLKYTWGDANYPVQQYKSTIFNDSNRYNFALQDPKWYVDYQQGDEEYSNAIDDMSQRLQIDSDLKSINNQNNLSTADTSKTITAYTPIIDVGIELERGNNGSGILDRTFEMSKMNFGVAKRPIIRVGLDKKVTNIRIVLANGSDLINTSVVDGKLEENAKWIKYVPTGPNYPGALSIEVDQEIIQGAKLELQYEFVVTNESELDYVITDENGVLYNDNNPYYKFGQKQGEQITIEAKSIVDYLDQNLTFIQEDEDWKATTAIELYNDKKISEEVKNDLKNYNNILWTEKLKGKTLKSGESTSVKYMVSKLLAGSSEELNFGNNAEILEVDKTGGGYIEESIPGNYIPKLGVNDSKNSEMDNASAEYVIITPPTGQDKNYILYSIIGITSFMAIGLGVIAIKKFVLGKYK